MASAADDGEQGGHLRIARGEALMSRRLRAVPRPVAVEREADVRWPRPRVDRARVVEPAACQIRDGAAPHGEPALLGERVNGEESSPILHRWHRSPTTDRDVRFVQNLGDGSGRQQRRIRLVRHDGEAQQPRRQCLARDERRPLGSRVLTVRSDAIHADRLQGGEQVRPERAGVEDGLEAPQHEVTSPFVTKPCHPHPAPARCTDGVSVRSSKLLPLTFQREGRPSPAWLPW